MLAEVPTHLAARLRAADDDVSSWLVLADWLEAHDDPRSELVRHGLGAPTTLDDEGAATVLAYVKRQLLDGLEVPERVELRWRRGFVVGIRVGSPVHPDGEAIVRLVEGLDERATTLLVALDVRTGGLGAAGVRRLVAAPALRFAARVRIAGNDPGRAWLAAIVEQSRWPLRSLAFTGSELGGADLRTLATGAGLSTVEHLDLSSNRLGAEVGLLARLPKLTSLVLDWNGLGAEGGSALGAPGWPGLRELSVVGNHLEAAGADALVRGRAHSLGSLSLAGNGLQGARGGQAIVRALPQLEELDLRGNPLGDDGVAAIAAVEAPRLRTLRLGTTGIGDAGAIALSQARWPALTHLELDDNRIGADGARALASASLEQLRELDLCSNRLGDAGAAHLASADGLTDLAKLWLSRNDIGDEGAVALAATERPHLGMLALETNRVGDRGALALSRARTSRPWLRVGLGGNPLSEAGWSALRESGLYELYYRRR